MDLETPNAKAKYSLTMERKSTLDATRQTQNLDTNYSKADFQSIVKNNCKHLNAEQQKKLLQLLMEYESLFDSTLGDWIPSWSLLN
jgi:hypothetical protein